MRINELEISGFKSFSKKTKIKFDHNFVAVVGPNGSGKSNVVDAIKWVFGESKTSSMRTKQATDVIFNGSETTSAKNMAQVTMVLDNKNRDINIDFKEISITRRMYRDGKNEYLINGTRVRLKDIEDLFAEQIIGKESMTIISQGKIEEIVHAKSQEKRKIIEEVAGIARYKKRKNRALIKLDQARVNLDQIAIIKNELERQLIPLEREYKKAFQYQELEKKRKELLQVSIISQLEIDRAKFVKSQQKNQSIKHEIELSEANKGNLQIKKQNNDEALSKLLIDQKKNNQKLQIINQDKQRLQTKFTILNEQSKKNIVEENSFELENKIKEIIQEQEELSNHINSKLSSNYKEKNQLDIQLSDANQNLIKFENQIIEANAIQKNKYPHSVNLILKRYPEFITIKDAYQVDNLHQNAIAAILGGKSVDIIAPNDKTIKQAINYLHEKKAGRAAFQNLTMIKSGNYDYVEIKEESIIGYAIDLITTSKKYRPMFNNLLKTTLVVTNYDAGITILKTNKKIKKVVTLDGTVIQTTGRINGGSKQKKKIINVENIIKQKKQTIKIKQKIITKIDSINTQNNKYHLQLRGIEQEIERNQLQLDKIKIQNPKEKDEKLQNLQMKIDQINNELKDHKKVLIDAETSFKILQSNKDKFYQQLVDIEKTITQLTNSLMTTNQELTKSKHAITIGEKQLVKEFQIGYELAKKKFQVVIDENEIEIIRKKVSEYTTKIKEIGYINLDAIQEYDKINNRYTFIKNQYDDLVIAKDKLKNIILKLDKIVIKQFQDTFDKLNLEFQKVFKELFDGGRAKLILDNKDDLLTSGVDLICQPPGKKLQTISLLSGGEKALTALAFIFAILKLRNVSYVILDEVEAALDEANVRRFALYVNLFSKYVQFIVITHRMGTMENAVVLYGVTMQKPGESKVIKVKKQIEEYNV